MRFSSLVLFASMVGCDAERTRECPTPIEGSQPFSMILTADGKSADGGSVGASVEAYFPKGRVAGAEVVLAFRQTAAEWRFVARGVLDEKLGSSLLEVYDGYCGNKVQGSFVGPSDGLEGEVYTNGSGPSSDVLNVRQANLMLCAAPGQATPTPQFTASSTELLASEILTVTGNVPLDRASLAIGSSPTRTLVTTEEGTKLSVGMKDSFPPYEDTKLDLSGVRDVMGRSLGLGTITVRGLTATLVERGFDAAPPAGAILGSEWSIAGSVLRVRSSTGGAYSALVGLGDPGARRLLHVRHRIDCDANPWTTRVRAISEAGTVVIVKAECSKLPLDATVTLPSGGRWALAIDGVVQPAQPCSYPARYSPGPYELADFAFE